MKITAEMVDRLLPALREAVAKLPPEGRTTVQ